MSSRIRFTLLCAALLASDVAVAQHAGVPITEADLRRHVDVLASDAFQGREPGTQGERLTTDYIVRELGRRGVEPAAAGGGWLQPVQLVARGLAQHQAQWTARGRPVTMPADALVLTARDDQARIADAPVVFAGHGAVMPERGINQLAGGDFRGAVALILYEGPQVDGFPSFTERVRALSAAGAVAVIGIVGPDLPWPQVRAAAAGGSVQLDQPGLPAAYGAMSWEGAQSLVRGAGGDLERLLNDQPGSSFRSVALPIRVSLQVAATVRRFTSNNVIGRVRGSGRTNESVVLLGHWDHIGLCAPEGAPDRICNGAVDNASGIATLIEAAGRLSFGERPKRDVLILATTAEEKGLLGAEAFALNPPVPRASIVAALNVDTAAVAPAGTPVAVLGGTPAMEQIVGRVAVGLGRRLDRDREADVMLRRQDAWALASHGIPAMMAGGNFSDLQRLGAFLMGNYHKPGDQPSAEIDYGGAAEDANLLAALARAFADPQQYPAPAAAQER